MKRQSTLLLGGIGTLLLTLGTLAFVGCKDPSSEGDEGSSDESAVKESDYEFELNEGDELERLDTMGVPLEGTILANKDRDLKGRRLMTLSGQNETEENNAHPLEKALAREVVTPYRTSAPYVGTPYLLALFDVNFMKLHKRWAQSLTDAGFEVCSGKFGDLNPVALCTLQMAKDENGKDLGKVAQLLVPDYLTVDIDESAGFPNGRTPDDPVGDYILAIGFLKMGGRCPDGPCNIKTFAKLKHNGTIGTNPPKNDRRTYLEKGKEQFPYLATPWFYWNEGDPPYDRDGEKLNVKNYWPKGARKKTPGPPNTKYAAPDPTDPTVPTPTVEQ